ncbi:MAG: transporter [Caldivirga sp. JCHS_4]|jgi:Major Facilitator Superfamily.|nr:MAG: transporter [Caldivirga sp. JCHS_4]
MGYVHEERWTREGVGAVIAQALGFMLDAYDLMFVTSLTPILAKVLLPSKLPAWLAYYITLFGYAFTLIARPVGSALFGNLGDRLGRRDTLMITILGFSGMSALMAAIPTYAQVGILAFIIFSIMRFIEGIFIGGEYAAGHAYAIEYSPSGWRGFVGGLLQGAFGVGVGLGGTVVALFTGILGEEAMYAYGWRYVFLTGLLPAVVAFALRYLLPDTPVFREVKEKGQLERVPFFSLFKPPVLWVFLQVMLLMTGLFFSSWSLFDFAVGVLTRAGLPLGQAAFYYGIAGYMAIVADTAWGRVSDIIGRRRAFIIGALASAIVAIPAWYSWYLGATFRNYLLLIIGTVVVGWITQWVWGMVPAYLSERFATQRRASGVGFGYSSGLFIGAWIPLYAIPLYALFYPIEDGNIWFTASFFTILAAVLYGIGAFLGPETRGVSMRDVRERLR